MDKDLADQVAGIAARVVASGAISANGPIGCWIEALAMFGLQDGVPVAGNAAALGGPVEIPPDLRAAALQCAMAFDRQGTVRV
jgi:hypothetical protein